MEHIQTQTQTRSYLGEQLDMHMANNELPSAQRLPGAAALNSTSTLNSDLNSTSRAWSPAAPHGYLQPAFTANTTTHTNAKPSPLSPLSSRSSLKTATMWPMPTFASIQPLSDVPTTELAPIQPQYERKTSGLNHTLPSLSSVTNGLQSTPEQKPAASWPSLNPLTAYYTPGYAQQDVEMNAASPERYYDRRSGSISLDDPDVRMAAEALGDLRADFVSSPPNRNTPLPSTPRDLRMVTASPRDSSGERPAPEPLLSLITASHPLLATTIEGATSAYNTGKNFSPHLKTGAEYIEDYLTPVTKTIGNVGRKTGIEGGVRWILGGSRKHGRRVQFDTDLEAGDRGSKRRRAKLSDKEKEALDRSFPDAAAHIKDRRTSVSTIDTLPAYDDHKSPAYTEAIESAGQALSRPGSSGSSEWTARIMVSTSSLGIAMRDESLRNLKYCLEGLRYANSCVSTMLSSLQNLIDQYDVATSRGDGEETEGASNDRSELVSRMNRLKNEIVTRISTTMKLVSDYAGSALPHNARELVHQQLMGLPSRVNAHLAREASSEPKTDANRETVMREGAHRVLLLAKEGLQMMTQVGDVLDRTIKSAEEWCTMMGKNKGDGAEPAAGNAEQAPSSAQWATTQSPFPRAADSTEDTPMTG